jgi:polar amino acid transport system substrate-binding protein
LSFRALLVCLFGLLLTGPALAAAPCGPYTVAFYEHGALYRERADGQWTGIDKDVVDELARRTGCRFEYLRESRVRIWTMLAGGQLDMSVSGIDTPERRQHSRFVPYLALRNYVLLGRDVDASIKSFEDFLADPRHKVAAIKSFKHGPLFDAWLDKLRAQGRVHETADFRSLMRLLEIGRVHAVIALQTSWAPMRAQVQAAGWRVMDWAPGEGVVGGLVLSRTRIPLTTVELFAATIAAMRQDGTLEAIAARHVGAELAPGLVQY